MNEIFQQQLKQFNLKLTDNNIDKLKSFCDLLIATNKKINLISKADIDNVLINHVADSLSFSLINLNEFSIGSEFTLIDIGSGGGFPAIPISILYPESKITMAESVNKKANFLKEVAASFPENNLSILPKRIEEIGQQIEHRGSYEIVTARALAQISVLLEYALPLLKLNGIFVSYSTEKNIEELSSLGYVLNILGGKLEKIINYNLIGKNLTRKLVIFKKVSTTPKEYPREIGIPSKKPIKNS